MSSRPDAAGMRHAATQLRSKSDRVSAVLHRLEAQVDAMTFAGPAATQFRGGVDIERQRLRQIADILRQAADALSAGASRVEADPTGFYSS